MTFTGKARKKTIGSGDWAGPIWFIGRFGGENFNRQDGGVSKHTGKQTTKGILFYFVVPPPPLWPNCVTMYFGRLDEFDSVVVDK